MTQLEALAAGRRAGRNSSARAAGEVIAKLASLALFIVVARRLGEVEFGVLVFAIAFLQIAVTPVGLGMDGYLLRQVARDHAAADRLFFDVLAAKVALAIPVLAAAFAVLWVIEDDPHIRLTVFVLSGGILLDVLGKSLHALFNARERSDLLAITVVAHRVFTAAVGIVALYAGADIVVVAGVYSLGALLNVALGFVFLRAHIGLPRLRLRPAGWTSVARRSAPFAVQDVLNVLLFKLDGVLLTMFAAGAAVGRYGAAYRLIESTMFVSWALASGFSAMYAYLGPETTPSVQVVFSRSIKLAVACLTPIAVAAGMFAEPAVTFFFGAGFRAAAAPLQLLAPVIVLLALVALGSVLITSQRAPRTIVPLTASAVVVNVGLNIALIPRWDERGAAAAMLITEILLAAAVLVVANRSVGGGIQWARVFASPLVAGAAMAIASLLLADHPIPALLVGGGAYVALLLALERRFNPGDVTFVRQLLRRSPRAEPPV